MKIRIKIELLLVSLFFAVSGISQPDWDGIKANATFSVPDDSYGQPRIQPINVMGWEDGLYMTRDGMHLYSTYLPLDAFSWLGDLLLDPICFDFAPYYRPPLLDIDTITNVFGCEKFMQSDIIIAHKELPEDPFNPWTSSNLQESFSFDGGAQGVLLNADTFDIFVYTKDGEGTDAVDIMFMRNVPINPTSETAVPILSSPEQEDNPHVERLNDSTLVIIFDRARYMYYSKSYDNGDSWSEPVLIPTVLNDQAPYDVQPHLWHDGDFWWVYFCADNEDGFRSIFRAKQVNPDDWENWDVPEMIIAPNYEITGYGHVFGVGEPTVSAWGDLSFVVVYGDLSSSDSTDVYDCDPWFMPKKDSPLSGLVEVEKKQNTLKVYPNPSTHAINISFLGDNDQLTELACYDLLGNRVLHQTIKGTNAVLDITALPSGIYMLNIVGEELNSVRFVKQ